MHVLLPYHGVVMVKDGAVLMHVPKMQKNMEGSGAFVGRGMATSSLRGGSMRKNYLVKGSGMATSLRYASEHSSQRGTPSIGGRKAYKPIQIVI